MSKSNSWETNLLELVFENTDATGIGDAGGLRGSVTPGSLYISLHTADPGEAGTQLTNETTYTNYVRVAVARSTAGWTVTGDTVDNDAAITFAQCGVTGATVTHVGIGTASSGAGELLYSGALDSSLAVSDGVTPEFAIGDLNVQEG
jgi:hypothetical protein